MRERKAGSIGDCRRSINPYRIATPKNNLGDRAQSNAASSTRPYFRRWFQKKGRKYQGQVEIGFGSTRIGIFSK
jgi:hypothetical protein